MILYLKRALVFIFNIYYPIDCVKIENMSDRYIDNPYPDFNDSEERPFLENGNIHNQLTLQARILRKVLLGRINEAVNNYKNSSDYSIYTGYCGTAFFHYFKYLKENDTESLSIARYLIDKALSNLKGRDISFLIGDAGPLALAIVYYSTQHDQIKVNQLTDRLIKLPTTVTNYPDEILFGRAGYIYALLFVNNVVSNAIPEQHIRRQVMNLLESGRQEATSSVCPLKYEWHEENYFGAAHGLAGILYIMLLNVDLLTQSDLNTLIKPTLDWLITKRYSSGNFPSSEGSGSDKLVQWCHGAPGFVNLYTLASQVFRDENYMKIALDCGDVVWNRGILRKGYSICHGVSGNAYTFVHLYQATSDQKHLHRLACFLDWCNTYPKNEGMKPDRPLSMFEGIAGVLYFLQDMKDPIHAGFPGFTIN